MIVTRGAGPAQNLLTRGLGTLVEIVLGAIRRHVRTGRRRMPIGGGLSLGPGLSMQALFPIGPGQSIQPILPIRSARSIGDGRSIGGGRSIGRKSSRRSSS